MGCNNNRNPNLIGYGIGALIVGVLIYHYYIYFVIALALFGLWFLFGNNDRNNRKGPPRC